MLDTKDPLEILVKDEGKSFNLKNKRWFLVCLAMTQFGFFYNATAVIALQKPIQEVLKINEFQYSLIILAQSFPNLFVPILTGVVIDRYGASLGLGVGLFFGVIGQLLLTIAIFAANYYLFLVGTMMCYISIELLFLGKSKMIRMWFKDNEIPSVVSISVFIQSVAIILCDVTYPTLYSISGQLGIPFAIGLGICSISLLFGTLKIILHEGFLKRSETLQKFKQPPKLMDSIRAMKSFPPLFWIIIFGGNISYGAYHASKAFESKFLMISFDFKIEQAGFILASGLVSSGIFGPISGLILDRTGKLTKGLIASAITILVGISLNAALPHCYRCLTPTVPFMLMVLGAAVRGIVLISSVMRLVPPKNICFAMAMLSTSAAIVNVGYPPVAGLIAQVTIDEYKYYWVFVANAILAVVGVTFAVVAHIIDTRDSKKLQYVVLGSNHTSFYSVEGLVERSIQDPILLNVVPNTNDENDDYDDENIQIPARSMTEQISESTIVKTASSFSYQF